ncbi:uncharacterized protein KD926_011369 [Aspergillus affinis]|uniref:uncharacterized protein n=1 Tax=Aspergillus affinis TaxID=1070780 RepID=UPI0022FF0CC7|nr:uncharacterized protein KD926_011369 [Aspergillus affinis]KAI9038031.1 hypothetical protein KD926_011369 [Aspergillus affinis]
MRGKQRSFYLVGILCIIFLATQPALCSTNSKSNNLECDSNLHEKCALGNPLLESFAGQEKERNPPAKVAIIGGGIAGLSTAYFLQNDKRLGNSTQITIFEREARIGGRIRTTKVYGTGSEVDTGGHTFDRDDNLINELAHAISIDTVKEKIIYVYDEYRLRRANLGALDRASLWDGEKLTINVAEEPPLNWPSLKQILRQDGLKPRFWMNLRRTLWQAATDENLRDSLEWYGYDDPKTRLEMIVWAAAWARPIPREADLKHFADTHSISLKPQSSARDGNMDLLSQLANHLGRDDSFSLKLGSTVTRIERHQDFNVYWTQDSDSGLEDTYSERFDYVIIAAPFSQSPINIHPAPSAVPQEVKYQPLHVTHFISRTALDRQTFNLPPKTKVPLMIWNTGQSTGDHKSPAPPFISIVQGSSDTCSGCVCSSEPMYRVISKENFSDSDIATLLRKNGKPRKEVTFSDQSCGKLNQDEGYTIGDEPPKREGKDEKVRLPGCVNNPDIRWIHREFWSNGMPLIQGERVEPMELAPNLFYVSGFEGREGASISKSVRNARKASDLLTEQFSRRLLI